MMRAAVVYCCACGAENPDCGCYCHRCGSALIPHTRNPDPVSSRTSRSQPRSANHSAEEAAEAAEAAEINALRALARIDVKPCECHGCGRTEGLTAYEFGLAKVLSAKRDWTRTAASVVISAVSVPLTGLGMIQLPGKRTRVRALRMKLILCETCRKKQVNYPAHPWWYPAQELSYDTFLGEEELKKLKPDWLSAGEI
jgi:hypothetical protein